MLRIIIKCIVAAVFLVLDGVPNFLHSIQESGVTIWAFVALFSNAAIIYIIISLLTAIWDRKRRISSVIYGFIGIMLASCFVDNKEEFMIVEVVAIIIFVINFLWDILPHTKFGRGPLDDNMPGGTLSTYEDYINSDQYEDN